MHDIGEFLYTEMVWIGSCSILYKALYPITKDVCILKETDCSELDDSSIYFYLLRQEGPLLSALDHANIISPLAHYEDCERRAIWLVLPFCKHGSLCDLIKRFQACNALPPMLLIYAVIRALTQALIYLHNEASFKGYTGILHRNITSKTVLVANDGSILLSGADFACPLELLDSEEHRIIYGNKTCAPPELADGKLTTSSDIWALGCLIYELCTGGLLFVDGARESNKGDFNPLDITFSSEGLTELCRRMLAINPDDRITLGEILENPLICNAPSTVLDLLPTNNLQVRTT